MKKDHMSFRIFVFTFISTAGREGEEREAKEE